MQQTKGSYRYINYIFSFSLVIVFAVIMAILIYSGANSYKNVKEHTDMTFNASTALGYIVNKIHGNDIDGVLIKDIYVVEEQPILPAKSRLQGNSEDVKIKNVTLENINLLGKSSNEERRAKIRKARKRAVVQKASRKANRRK